MIWVDSSVWLEIALDQEKAQICEDFITSSTESIYAADFDIYTIILTMLRYKRKMQDVKTFLGVLHGLENLTIFRPSASCIINAMEEMEKHTLSFDDALAYACMKFMEIKKIATLDRDFKKLNLEFVL